MNDGSKRREIWITFETLQLIKNQSKPKLNHYCYCGFFNGGLFVSLTEIIQSVLITLFVCWHLRQCLVTDNLDLVLRLPCSLADYKLQEVTLVCNQSHPVQVSVSTVDIMSLQRDSTNPAYRNTLVRPTYSYSCTYPFTGNCIAMRITLYPCWFTRVVFKVRVGFE